MNGKSARLALCMGLVTATVLLSPLTLAAPVTIKEDSIMFKRLFAGLGKSNPVPDIIALQDAAVRSIAGDVTDLQDGEWDDRHWVYLAVNHEILVEEGRRTSTQASVLAQRPGQELEDLDFRLSPTSKAHLLALRDAMADVDKKTWTIVDLVVERNGKYDFAFSYDPPPRLNGNLLHSPLSGLLERYLKDRSK